VTSGLRVGIIGCGLIGRKRAEALGSDELVGCYDVLPEAAKGLVAGHGGVACSSVEALLGLSPDVVIIAAIHSELSKLARLALQAGAHILVEKPAGRCRDDVVAIQEAAEEADRLVKVGFNHRFHPGIHRAISEARSGMHGEVFFARARYGHGARLGYESEWRCDPALSGGGEIVDQGMHLLDLFYWLFGELPLSSSLLRTHFWGADVDDNAVLVLGERGGPRTRSPWALAHVSWTEWKNRFSFEIVCRHAKLDVDGLVRSYGPQRLTIYRMRPELGPPDTEVIQYSDRDLSWEREWAHFAEAIRSGQRPELLGDLNSAAYAWGCVEEAYR
jgi:predicted dehydrogenase